MVAPTPRELGGLRPGRQGSVQVAATGLGRAAKPALERLLEAHPVQCVLSLGFAGALTPQGHTGALVVCSSFLAYEPDPLPPLSADAGLLEWTIDRMDRMRLPYHYGDLLTSPRLLSAPDQKRRAGLDTGAAVVDMEGYWLAQVAAAHQTPFVALRSVLDPARYTLPKLAATIVEDQGQRELQHTLRFIFTHWVHGPLLLPLAYRSWRARRTLRRAARSLAPEMARRYEGVPS